MGGGDACQDHGYDEEKCLSIGCCAFDGDECWSDVEDFECVGYNGTNINYIYIFTKVSITAL